MTYLAVFVLFSLPLQDSEINGYLCNMRTSLSIRVLIYQIFSFSSIERVLSLMFFW